jgi:hypothetical protein
MISPDLTLSVKTTWLAMIIPDLTLSVKTTWLAMISPNAFQENMAGYDQSCQSGILVTLMFQTKRMHMPIICHVRNPHQY